MNLSRRFDVAAGIFVLLVFLLTLYLTKDFLNTILLSIVLVFLLRPLYAVFFRLTHRRQVSSLFSILIVFIVILGFLVGITTVLLVEMVNLERSGAVSGSQITALIQEMELWAKSSIPAWIYNSIIEIVLRIVANDPYIPYVIDFFEYHPFYPFFISARSSIISTYSRTSDLLISSSEAMFSAGIPSP